MQSSIVTALKIRGRTPRKPQRTELALHSIATPAFGQADLSNCEREQIHLAGSIQPHGALLLVTEPELSIVQASNNAPHLLGLPDSVVGRPMAEISVELARLLDDYQRQP